MNSNNIRENTEKKLLKKLYDNQYCVYFFFLSQDSNECTVKIKKLRLSFYMLCLLNATRLKTIHVRLVCKQR